MTGKGPGKYFRKGLTLAEFFELIPDYEAAEKWFISVIWPNGVRCPRCDSDNVQSRPTRKPMPFCCRACRKDFSVKSATVMRKSKLGLRVWAVVIYQVVTSLKGVASLKLHRDLGIQQRSSWHLAHRIREAMKVEPYQFKGLVEADETFIGGKRRNMSWKRRRQLSGRGAAGKATLAGAKARSTNQVYARVVEGTDRKSLHGFVGECVHPSATVYTDEALGYRGITQQHETVNHSKGEYVRGPVHTNGIESFWAPFKRAIYSTFHHVSPKHLNRYAAEFAGRHGLRQADTLDQMAMVAVGMLGVTLTFHQLVHG